MVQALYRSFAVILVLAALGLLSAAQDTTSGGPDSVITGPYGVPRLVMSEGGQWVEPIEILEDEKAITYVPDITSPGWAQWHVSLFRSEGIYFTYLYIYRKDTRETARVTIYVYTTTGKVKIVFSMFGPIETFDIPKAPPIIARSIPKITAIVQDQSDHFRGPTLDEALKAQKLSMGRIYYCYLNPESCHNTDPKASNDPNRDPNIDPPKTIYTPLAQYSAEAQAAKIEGIVLLSVTVDTEGYTKNVQIIRPLGHGLDEAAVTAVRQYRFMPATDKRTGKAVEFAMKIEVNFRLK